MQCNHWLGLHVERRVYIHGAPSTAHSQQGPMTSYKDALTCACSFLALGGMTSKADGRGAQCRVFQVGSPHSTGDIFEKSCLFKKETFKTKEFTAHEIGQPW